MGLGLKMLQVEGKGNKNEQYIRGKEEIQNVASCRIHLLLGVLLGAVRNTGVCGVAEQVTRPIQHGQTKDNHFLINIQEDRDSSAESSGQGFGNIGDKLVRISFQEDSILKGTVLTASIDPGEAIVRVVDTLPNPAVITTP